MSSGNKFINTLKDYPLAVACFVFILVCAAAIFMRGGAALELSAKEADLNSRIRTIDQNVKNAKDLEEEVEELKVLVEQFELRLFNREQRAININFFYGIEDRLDVRIANISQSDAGNAIFAKGGPRELKLHSTIGYNIALKGQFDEILTFLYELYRVDALIRVADFQITVANARDGEEGLLDARLKVLVLAETE
jgi:hypothetical protein